MTGNQQPICKFKSKIKGSMSDDLSERQAVMESEVEDVDSFDSEDAEFERELEEQIRKAQEEGKDKIFEDVSDAASVMSMSHTMSNMNFIPVDTDLDVLLEHMIQNQNPQQLAEMERQRDERLAALREEQLDTDAMIYTEENRQNIEDMKQLNQINLAEIIVPDKPNATAVVDQAPEESKKAVEVETTQIITTTSASSAAALPEQAQTKTDYLDQIKQAREKAAAVEFKFAEDAVMVKFEEEKKQKAKVKEDKLKIRQVTKAQKESVITSKQPSDKPPLLKSKAKPKLSKIEQKKKEFEDHQKSAQIEIERMQMVAEDELSLKAEVFNHQQKFAQKDEAPPKMPRVFVETGRKGAPVGPLTYRELQPTPRPQAPAPENYQKFEIKLRLPTQLDLTKVKVLWSKEKETAEQEAERKAEAARRKAEKRQKLSQLVAYSKSTPSKAQDIFKKPQAAQIQSATQKIEQVCRLQLPCESGPSAEPLNRVKIQRSAQEKPVEDKTRAFEKNIIAAHQRMVKDCQFTLAAIQKQLPTSADEFDEFKSVPPPRQDNAQVQHSDCLMGQALELNAAEAEMSRAIELKNEQLGEVDLCKCLAPYGRLIHLDLSMNKITSLKGGFEACPNLRTLSMSDNLLRELSPFLFQKSKQLRSLNLDINQISKLQNLHSLTSLQELSVQNNRIGVIEGLSSLTKLRRLNLSFNRITKLEGLSTCQMLEFVELGKNQIRNVDALAAPQNKFVFLTELYLYINEVRAFPRQLSLPQLKILNLNQNSELGELDLGYCPLLETISASQCAISELNSLQGCQSLREVDISFNQMASLPSVFNAIQFNDPTFFKSLIFNDNAFNQVQDAQHQVVMTNPLLTNAKQFNSLLIRAFPQLTKINGEYVRDSHQASSVTKQTKPRSVRSREFAKLHSLVKSLQSYRSFNTKQLYQKILITFAGTTPLMKLQTSILPFTLAERLLKIVLNTSQDKRGPPFCVLSDSLFYQNLGQVHRQRQACRAITTYVVTKRVKQKALLNRMRKQVPRVLKLQALVRGHLCRVRNAQKVAKIRRDGLKGTKKYKAANKIQALFRGFAFRIKRKRALAKLGQGGNHLDGEEDALDDLEGLMGEGDFDAEAFLGVKQENLEKVDIFSGANASLMDKYIQVLSYEQQQKGKVAMPPPTGQFSHPARRQVSTNEIQATPLRKNSQLPPIKPSPGGSVSGSTRDLSKPKSFHAVQKAQATGQSLDASLTAMRNRQAFARGSTPQRRQIQQMMHARPGGSEDQISEIDMNSDARSMHSANLGHARLPLKQNNLMGTGNDFAARANNSKFGNSLNEHGWGGSSSQFNDSRGLLDAGSAFGGSASGSNLFHPKARDGHISSMEEQKAKLKEAARLKDLEKQKIAEEWGFQNPASMAIWEARQRKKKAGAKKNVKLTADQKLEQFRKLAGKK